MCPLHHGQGTGSRCTRWGDAISAAIDARVPRAKGRRTDVPACAGCPGDCGLCAAAERRLCRLTPGLTVAWETSEQKAAGTLPCKWPWSKPGGKKKLLRCLRWGGVWQGLGAAGGARPAVHDPMRNEPCQAALTGFLLPTPLGCIWASSSTWGWGPSARGWRWGSAHPAHSHKLLVVDPKSSP